MRIRTRITSDYDEIHDLHTDDGLRITLLRRCALGERPRRYPVLLCHGMTSNRFNLDWGEVSLATYLRHQGYDVWLIELRGCGNSQRAGYLRYDPRFSFEGYVHHDVPAALAFLRSHTGHKQVHWIGHSMGGMIAYAYLASYGAAAFKSVTTLASPAYLKPMSGQPQMTLTLGLLLRLRRFPVIPSPAAFRVGLWLYNIAKHRLYRDRMDLLIGDYLNELLTWGVHGISPLPSRLVREFAHWVRNGHITRLEDGFDYTERLLDVRVPMLLMVSGDDELVPVSCVRYLTDRAPDNGWVFEQLEYGREGPYTRHYGHMGVVIHPQAVQEIFPRIDRWLSTNDRSGLRVVGGRSGKS